MPRPPTGTVTFRFTDIEGSTRLLERLGHARYAEALNQHHGLVRSALAANGGTEVGVEGDAFFVVFGAAAAAVAAARDIQRALGSQRWPDGEELRVRMGLHTVEPIRSADAYVGLAIHRAARIAAAAHGGQVLLSRTTRDLLGEELPEGVSLRDLGEHRLKDLTQPEQLYQLLIQGLAAEFPPVRTLDHQPTNLPTQPTPLVGRERELGELLELLGLEDVRLLTLIGPGGSGKTRLGVQAAAELIERFPDGVYFVSLAPLEQSELMLSTVAETLGMKESGAQPLAQALADHLRGKELLLLLDNVEHLPDAGTDVAFLLGEAPKLQVLVTSRAPLRVLAEHEYPVQPLALPDPGQVPRLSVESLLRYDALALFVERARSIDPRFEGTSENVATIAEICVRLDGLPLAIELAAARIRTLPPQALADGLQQCLKLLTGGARDLPSRQQTLRATIDWSYRLLTRQEQRLFSRVGVFAGGFTLRAATAICEPWSELGIELLDGLSSLVEKSLLRQAEGPDGQPRFSLLETVREYALEELGGGTEAAELRERHARYFSTLAGRGGQELMGPGESVWLKRLRADHDNLRAALAWAGATGRAELQLRTAAALWIFWWASGQLSEGRRWLDSALENGGAHPQDARAAALVAAAPLARDQGDYERMRILAEESLGLYKRLGDDVGIARSFSFLGSAAEITGELDEARRLYEHSVVAARRGGDSWSLAVALNNLGNFHLDHDDAPTATIVWQEPLQAGRQLRNPAGTR